MKLLDIRRDFSDSQCLDPRDRINAILALVDENEKGIYDLPDYTKPAIEVYREVTWRHIQHYQSINILRYCSFVRTLLALVGFRIGQ